MKKGMRGATLKKGICSFMSYPNSPLQQLFKSCLQLLYGLIFAVLVIAFMILPETLISETISSEALKLDPRTSQLELSGIASPPENIKNTENMIITENMTNTYKMSFASDNASADWYFHLQFPFVGRVSQDVATKQPVITDTDLLSRLSLLLRKLAEETRFLPAAMQ